MLKSRGVALYAAAWVPVAIGFSLALGATQVVVPLSHALVAGTLGTLPAALLGALVIVVCRRFPWSRAQLGTLALVHTLGAIVFTALWSATIAAEIRIGATERDLLGFVNDGLAWQLLMGLFAYAVIAGAAYTHAAFRRQEEQERAAARAEMLQLRAELDSLRARLHPHFLFNVLQTLGALVEHKPREAHAAIEHLARLLKRRLDRDPDAGDDAPLAEELEDVRDYCDLERLRLGARLAVVEEIDPETLELTVPRFTLQPLVENAIRHGIAPRAAPGRLTVRAKRHGASWTLAVLDDGVGADPATVALAKGLGLSVVRERLRLRYGDQSAFSTTTAPRAGFAATLTLPAGSDAARGTARAGAS